MRPSLVDVKCLRLCERASFTKRRPLSHGPWWTLQTLQCLTNITRCLHASAFFIQVLISFYWLRCINDILVIRLPVNLADPLSFYVFLIWELNFEFAVSE